MDDLFCGNFTREEQYDRAIGEYTLYAVPIRSHENVLVINSQERR